MNIKSPAFQALSDSALLTQIKLDAAQERAHGLAVIHQLSEIRRRRLDAQLGYDSLHKYCMEELGYSPGSAWRRINAMYALTDLPEIENRLEKGELTLASVSQVQSFCRREAKTIQEKNEILNQVAGLSKRETERVLAQIAPLPERPERIRELGVAIEIRVTLHAETLAALDQIKNLISHARPNASYAEVIEYLAKMGVKKLDPTILPPGENRGGGDNSGVSGGRSQIWLRDGGRCTYVSPGGKTCGSQTFLQVDHIIPRAKGGSDDPSNLRLRCRAHNLLAAVEEFGEAKMASHLKKPA
jgi:hypothetical protein